LAKVSDYITADPREAALLHSYVYHQLPDYFDLVRFSERRKIYKALLSPEKDADNPRQRFLDIFDKTHTRSLMFRQHERQGIVYTRGILHEKDLIMLVLIHTARNGGLARFIDNTMLRWQHGRPISFNRDDKDIIAFLGDIKPRTKDMGALNRMLKKQRVYIPESALYGANQKTGLLQWLAQGLYAGIPEAVKPAQQLDLFEYNKIRFRISQSA
jgi:hypothetical protein